MSELLLSGRVETLVSRGEINDDDVQILRRGIFRDGVVSRIEAEALFEIDERVGKKCEAWTVFFVEAISDFLIHQEAPTGYVSQENAAWLINAISGDGLVNTSTEMELLIRIVEKATNAPEELSLFAMKQITQAVIEGEGPLAGNRTLTKGVIGQAEVEMLRRLLYGLSSAGGITISRAEAETLFDLNDQTVEVENHPSWSELFIKAITCFLMSATGHQAPTREEAFAQQVRVENTEINIGNFFSRAFSGGFKGYLNAINAEFGVEKAYAEKNAALSQERAIAETISSDETKWLVERIGRDGQLHDNEKSLLQYLKQESPSIHPDLESLILRAA